MDGKPFVKLATIASALLLALNFAAFAQNDSGLDYVDPFIGTTKSNVITKWGNDGGTYPGAVAPSGAVQLTPETRVTGDKGYDYTDSSIYYFSCFSHYSGFPGGSSGWFYIMPVNSSAGFEVGKYSRRFSHQNEFARPGYYKVVFDDDHTIAEATVTRRAGMFRFTFAANIIPEIFIADAGKANFLSKKILQFSLKNTVVNFNENYQDIKHVRGGWIITFSPDVANKKEITLKLSASSVSFAGAQNNINQEIAGLTFDEIRKQTDEEWKKKLAVVEVIDNNKQNKTVFYTALYHSLLIPWVIDDADGQYAGDDGKIHYKSGQNQYGGFSPWDTFRSLNPLLSLLYPDKENDIILSMLDIYKQTGHLPTESMTGNHAVPIIVDSYLKGITNFDKQLAYKAMKSNIVDTPFVQQDMEVYHQMGYVPFTSSESVTRTVEYAYDDWALSQYAKLVVGNNSDYKLLQDRGFNYRNLLNADELLLLPRNKNEFKLQPGMSGYKEGDKWVYSYFVPQNAKDLINLFGGNDQFATRLDSALSHNVILFDNEPVFHLPYLFNLAGHPELTQKWCRKIMSQRFSAAPGGLPGNDDLGSTSSWYVFSAMGLYPFCPGRPMYTIGSPMFQSVTLHLPNGKTFVIKSENSSQKNPFVQSVYLNEKPLQTLLISHSTLTKGGKIVFNMGNRPANWPLNKNPIELSETKNSPDFNVSNCSFTKTHVEPDELFFVKFSVTNKGSLGTKTMRLSLNGKQYGYKNCRVAPGETIKDSIPCRLYPIGKSILQIDGNGPGSVVVTTPKDFTNHTYKITRLRARPLVKWQGVQQVAYTIQNIGGLKKVFDIPVRVNDSIVFRDKLTLAPGEKKDVRHRIAATKPGFQHIVVDNFRFTYKVYHDNRESLLLDLSPVERSGNIVNDESGFNNSGYIEQPQVDHTKTSNEKLLFGQNCFVEVMPAPSLDDLGETITMMAWVYPTETRNGLTDIFTKGDTNVLQVSFGKTLTFFAGGWGRGDCTVDLPSDWLLHWHHIAGVCSGKTICVYIDGILKGTTITDAAVNLSVNNKWVLGRNDEFPSERVFDGYMVKAKIFREALSANEILAEFNAYKDSIR